MYRKSFYIIKGNTKIGGKYELLYSSISTKLIALESFIFDAYMNERFDEIPKDIFSNLLSENFIIESDKDELADILKNNTNFIKADKNTLYQAISPSLNCQLGCGYCGQVHINKNFSEINEKKLFNRVLHNLSKKDYKSLGVSWFGGEPLMGLKSIKNLSTIFIKHCGDNKINYSAKIVTNGLSLKNNIFKELLNIYMVDEFEITLDGIAEYHDKRRKTKSNEKTFDIIITNLENIVNDESFLNLNKKPTIIIRSNIDKENALYIKQLIEILEEKNILKHIKFYLAPIHSWGNDAHLNALTMDEFAKIELEINLILLDKRKNIQFIPGAQKNIVCMSLKENAELFDANGDLFNCSEISQVPLYEKDNNKHKVANYINNNNDFIDSVDRPFSNWNDEIINSDLPCKTCKILPICGGSCPKLWSEGIVACPSMKYNFEDRMLVQFYENNKNDFVL